MSERDGYTTTVQSIASGGTGGEPTAVDTKDGKIVRIRPLHIDEKYTPEELADSMWELDVDGKKLRPEMKAAPNYMALAYKERVYSKNRVRKPLKRVDWEPGGDPEKIHAENRGKSKFVEISWDEALDIMESELKRLIDKYGPYTVLCVGEDGHRESKDLHAGGGMHATVMNFLGGYTRETRTLQFSAASLLGCPSRLVALEWKQPRGAADRSPPDGLLPLPRRGPGGCCHRRRSPFRTTDRKLPGARPRPGNVGVARAGSDRSTIWRIPSWKRLRAPGPCSGSTSGSGPTGPAS